MKKLHPTQELLLDLLKRNIDDPLTIRDLKEELEISSTSVVFHHIKQLEKKGYLRRNPANPHDYQILADDPEKKITYLNMYGMANCNPSGSILDGSPIERIPISTRLIGFASKDAFLVKANGDSMKPKINPGDLLITKRNNKPENGKIMVCVYKGEVMVKKVIVEKNNYILASLNQKYNPIMADEKDLQIEGEVRGIFTFSLDF